MQSSTSDNKKSKQLCTTIVGHLEREKVTFDL